MKFLLFSLVIAIIIIAFFSGMFYSRLELSSFSNLDIMPPAATSTATTPRAGTTSRFAPPSGAFHGPTSQPHVIGPTAPPPNY